MGRPPLPGWTKSSGRNNIYTGDVYYIDQNGTTIYGGWSIAHPGSWYMEDERGKTIGYLDYDGRMRDANFRLI